MAEDAMRELRALLLGELPYARPDAPEPELLADLAPFLPEDLLLDAIHAIAAAGTMPRVTGGGGMAPSAFLRTLAALLEHLPGAGHEVLLARLVSEFAELAPVLPSALLDSALVGLRPLGYGVDRARALVALAGRLPGPQGHALLLEEALSIAQEAGDLASRREQLVELLSGLREPLPEAAVGPLMDAIARVGTERDALELAIQLLPHLPRAEQLAERWWAWYRARAVDEPAARFWALARVGLQFPDALQAQLLPEAWAAAQEVEAWDLEGIELLVDLAVRLAPPLKGEALQRALAASRTLDGRARVAALACLAPHADDELRSQIQAEADARDLPAEEWVPLAGYLSAAQLSGLLEEMCDRFPFGLELEDGLAELARYLPPALLSWAVERTAGLDDPEGAARILGALAPAVASSERLTAKATAAARAIDQAWWRARALAALAPHLPQAGRAEIAAEVARVSGERMGQLLGQVPQPERTELLSELVSRVWDHVGGAPRQEEIGPGKPPPADQDPSAKGGPLPRELLRPGPPPRHANATLVEKATDTKLSQERPLAPGTVSWLRLDIGELSKESAVERPEPLPEHLLPEDIWLEVMVSSSHFAVGHSLDDVGESNVAHGRFFLPSDGRAATTPEGETYLYFPLRAPDRRGTARARIGYYYRNHLVQSQLLTADVGDGAGGYGIQVDYTLSQSLRDLGELPLRRQVSIVTNDNGNGRHQIALRSGSETGETLVSCTYELDEEAVGKLVKQLREILADRAPTEKKQSRDDLEKVLRELAPVGHALFWVVMGPHIRELVPVLKQHHDVVIQVSRPTTASYSFPWGLMYDSTLELGPDWSFDQRKAIFCPTVKDWDEVSAMVARGLRQCPNAPNGRHAPNTLCPFGFWGYRYAIEQLPSTRSPVHTIGLPATAQFAVVSAQTQQVRKPEELAAHIGELRQVLQARFPQADISEGKDRATIKNLLARDTPLVYFYCHGERPLSGSPDTYLGVGKDEAITAIDFQSWIHDWLWEGKVVWDRLRPLVFINACHSVEINPDTLVSYLDAFVGTAAAAGVIGTEVKVNQALAMEVAIEFFRRFFDGVQAEQALHEIRLDFLAHGNLLGLVYTPYCWANLHVVKA